VSRWLATGALVSDKSVDMPSRHFDLEQPLDLMVSTIGPDRTFRQTGNGLHAAGGKSGSGTHADLNAHDVAAPVGTKEAELVTSRNIVVSTMDNVAKHAAHVSTAFP
jgi:hypothetical protein